MYANPVTLRTRCVRYQIFAGLILEVRLMCCSTFKDTSKRLPFASTKCRHVGQRITDCNMEKCRDHGLWTGPRRAAESRVTESRKLCWIGCDTMAREATMYTSKNRIYTYRCTSEYSIEERITCQQVNE
ncbi:hypothetical protein PUN28_013441 [Cardiocondyla obscurior]|uniref:Secreted protein n=1 Tax=Cardiocondyla obscurior TaxID=286306 RepID=A0AAW2F5G9_9HYME